ncbi:MAG: hypothetical protein LBI49_05100, partial [Nocardiopsaceae bacterium]|nr:hypothetical protein [Nocardiopsaceae bacterium]
MNQPLRAQHPGVPRFEPGALAGELPPAAVSYFSFSIQPGTPLAGTAEIVFAGRVRLKPGTGWLPFQATETIHAGRSFRVTARARRGPLTAVVADSYRAGQARSQVRAFGVIPVRVRRGADLARSARGRLVAESVWLPPAFLPGHRVRWSGGSRDTARLTVP